MTRQELIDQLKTSLRISHNALDNDISFNIDVCLEDLKRIGLNETLCISTTDNKMIQKAIELFCKSEFNFNGAGERFDEAYTHFIISLALSNDFNGGGADES